jgi:hypothetical protein
MVHLPSDYVKGAEGLDAAPGKKFAKGPKWNWYARMSPRQVRLAKELS